MESVGWEPPRPTHDVFFMANEGFFGWDSLLGSRNNPGDDDPASYGPGGSVPTQNVGEEHATLHATSFDVAQP